MCATLDSYKMPTVSSSTIVKHEYPHPSSSSNNIWWLLSHVTPPSKLALMVIWFLFAVVFGLEKSKRSLPKMFFLASTCIKLAIQTGSCNAVRVEICSSHVLPKSLVIDTAHLERFPPLVILSYLNVPAGG